MYYFIKTDNDFANEEFRARLVNDPVLAALIDLLVAKGIVNQVELGKAINDRCQALVSAKKSLAEAET